MQRRGRGKRVVLVTGCALGLMFGCAGHRVSKKDFLIARYWGIAQTSLASEGLYVAYDITPDMFTFQYVPSPFECGVIMAIGCFKSKERLIQYTFPQVIAHEATHAILWQLGYSCWRCAGHDGEPGCEEGCHP